MIRRTSFVVWLLLASLGASVWASCTDEASRADTQMACCVAGHHECGASNDEASCCKTSVERSRDFVLAKAVPIPAPVFTAVAPVPTLLVVADAASQRATHVAWSGSARAPDTPTYLLISTLLI